MSEVFKAKVRNVGTSLGILVPKELNLRKGEEVQVTILKPNKKILEKMVKESFGMAKGTPKFERDHTERSL